MQGLRTSVIIKKDWIYIDRSFHSQAIAPKGTRTMFLEYIDVVSFSVKIILVNIKPILVNIKPTQ